MPNKSAKSKKWKRQKLNAQWKVEGRTSKQHKKWLKNNKNKLGV